MIPNKTNQYLIEEALEELVRSDIKQLKDSLTKLLNQRLIMELFQSLIAAVNKDSHLGKKEAPDSLESRKSW